MQIAETIDRLWRKLRRKKKDTIRYSSAEPSRRLIKIFCKATREKKKNKNHIRCVILASRIRKLVDRVGSLFISALF